jgi:hypothetical protein
VRGRLAIVKNAVVVQIDPDAEADKPGFTRILNAIAVGFPAK